MKPTALVLGLFLMLEPSSQLSIESIDEFATNPGEPLSHIKKRENPNHPTKDFIEKKLIQHTHALEHLVLMSQQNEHLIKKLIHNLNSTTSDKVDFRANRRSSNIEGEDEALNKDDDKYATLLKDALETIKADSEYIPDQNTVDSENKVSFRSAYWNTQTIDAFKKLTNVKKSHWCTVGASCTKTNVPVCGYDEKFGYAKFHDMCHMMNANCYWKYNFSLAPNCNPSMS